MDSRSDLDRRRDRQLYARPARQLIAFILGILLLSQLALSAYAWSLSERRFLPELERKAKVVGASVSAKLARAVAYGIPFNKLEGVGAFYDDILRDNSDLAYLRLTDAGGRELQRRGVRGEAEDFTDTRSAIVQGGVTHGYVHVGVARGFIAQRVLELRYDIAIVLLASLLIAFEVLWFIITLNFSAPMRQIIGLMSRMAAGDFRYRALASPAQTLAAALHALERRVNLAFADLAATAGAAPHLQPLRAVYRFAEDAASVDLVQQRVVAVRLLTFLFMFAEMLSRPFLPLYAASLGDYGLQLHEGLRASLPVSAFLLAVALAMPFAGRWSDLTGRRRSYLAGALLAAAGLAASGLFADYGALLAGRVASGIGYALMFMACQGYVMDKTGGGGINSSGSAAGMAMFVSAIMVAEICAPAVGGILADRIGYRAVFGVGAGVALLAAVLALAILDRAPPVPAPAPTPAPTLDSAPTLVSLRRNRRFMALSCLSGIPAKFFYSGFLIFLVPLLLAGMGSTRSEIGRYTMLYGLSALALAPLFARLADRFQIHALLVAAGGLLTGLGLLPIAFGGDADLVLAGIGALGIGQSMSISAQLVLVTRVTEREARHSGSGAIVGVYRLLERLGAVAGPLVAGALVATLGARHAVLVLGIAALVLAAAFALVYRVHRPVEPA